MYSRSIEKKNNSLFRGNTVTPELTNWLNLILKKKKKGLGLSLDKYTLSAHISDIDNGGSKS